MAGTAEYRVDAVRERRNVVLCAVMLCCIIVVVTALCVWSFSRLVLQQAQEQAIQMAHITMSKDLNLRKWVADMGGIYAPVTPATPPNRWLRKEGRDFTLPNGQEITRINPAYAYRLVQEYWQQDSSGRGRLVSLKPIRPQNMADAWEAQALRDLTASGEAEKVAEQMVDGVPRIRLLRILRAQENCLVCHAEYGFKEGDILGGLSVIPPVDEVGAGYRDFSYKIMLLCVLVAALCIALIIFFSLKLLEGIRRREASSRQLEELVVYMDKRVEERTRQLRSSNSISLRLLNATDDGIIGVDEESRIIFANRVCTRLLGYKESDLLGKPLHDVLCPVDSEGQPISSDKCRLCHALHQSRTLTFDSNRFRGKDGKMVLVSGRVSSIVEDGIDKGGIVAFRDISSARMAELWQKVFFNQAREIFFIVGPDHKFVDCNMAAVEWLGLSSKDDLLHGKTNIYPQYQEDGIRTSIALHDLFARCDAMKVIRFSWLFRHVSGRILPCEGSMVRQDTQFGRSYFVALHDLEALRNYENQLESERTLLQETLEGAPSAMLVCDEQYRVLACNNGAQRKLAIGEGDYCLGLWQEPEAIGSMCVQVLQGQRFFKVPMRLHPFGDTSHSYHMLCTASFISYRNRNAILFWLQDVTEIMALRLAAEASARSKSSFLAHMSHEIRTPLNAIIGMSQIASNSLDDPDKAQKALGEVQASSRHLLSLLNSILDISKIEHGKMELDPTPEKISELYNSACYIIEGRCREKQIQFEKHVEDLPDTHLLFDKLRLNQVIINLLDNAVKFTPSGGNISLGLKLVEENPASVTLAFRIADTGIGMTEEQVERVFNPFEQADGSTNRCFGGTGLGLTISQSLVQMMGGRIRLTSTQGKGSVFAFELTFPRAEGKQEDTCCQSLEGLDLSGKNILLVEDVFINREIVKEALSVTGANVVEAGDGAEALEIFHSSGSWFFSIIFMDVQMPRMDGHETSRLIRAMPDRYATEIPIVAMTANAFSEDVEAALACGMNAHLAKPLDLAQLRQVLETWVLQREQEEQEDAQG